MSRTFRKLSIVLALAFLVALASAPVRAEETAAPATLTTDDYQVPQLRADCKAAFPLPPSARRAVGDTVLNFQAIVLKDGSVGYVELLNDDRPYPGIEQSAREALRYWKYDPGKLAGQPVDAGVRIIVQFRGAAAASMTKAANQWTPRSGDRLIPGLDKAIFTGSLPRGDRPLDDDPGLQTTPRPQCQFQAGPRCGYMSGNGPKTLVDLPVAVGGGR